MHLDTLTPEAKGLFPKLAAFKGDFYLAGGTALALQLGHRISIDFDLFSPEPIKKTLLARIEDVYGVAPSETLVSNSGELTVIVSGVKHTFLHYPFPPMRPLVEGAPISLLAAEEILATKAYTIGRRGAFKDYIDIMIGIERSVSSLSDIIALACEKYGDAFNDRTVGLSRRCGRERSYHARPRHADQGRYRDLLHK
jgi:hypothetical protein